MNATRSPYRVLIVDDAPAVREALRWAFEAEPDLEIVGEAEDGAAALIVAATLCPDVVILDIELPVLDGYAVARSLKAVMRPPVVLFLTVHSDLASRAHSQAAGGDAFVEKGTGWPSLLAQLYHTLGVAP